MTADEWIARLRLVPHPEGGHYRESYRAAESVGAAALPARYGGARALATAIYYLLCRGEMSVLHRVRSDEMWHFYDGDPLGLSLLDDAGPRTIVLGRDGARGEVPQAVVAAGTWFGAAVESPGTFALVGCTVAPGFDFADLEIADRATLTRAHPAHAAFVERWTR
jgi:predicted cupin superfamily sugar epimerase